MAIIDINLDTATLDIWNSGKHKQVPVVGKDVWKFFKKLTGLELKEMQESKNFNMCEYTFTDKSGKKLVLDGFKHQSYFTVMEVPMDAEPEEPAKEPITYITFKKGETVTFSYYKQEYTGKITQVTGSKVMVQFEYKGQMKTVPMEDSKLTKVE